MKPFIVKDIVEICHGILYCGDENRICEHFSKDTRSLEEGDVYVGIKGETFDGNLLYEEAFKQGASVCVLEKVEVELDKTILENYPSATIVIVKDTIKAIQDLASKRRNQYDIPVIAVTGSVGKTSTKDMIASVIEQAYHVQKTQGNYNNHIGLPLTILGLKDHTALIVEMGMNHAGEIRTLTNIAKPTICVITNVGTAHIGNLGSRENILKAKLEILEGMQEDGTVIINQDNDLLRKWGEEQTEYQVMNFGIEYPSMQMANEMEQTEWESHFVTQIQGKKTKVNVPVGGIHFIYNALCAICVGNCLHMEPEVIVKGIAAFEGSKQRMERFETKDGIGIINDCYNANVDSMKAALSALGLAKAKRKMAVLGDMLELGQYAKVLHEEVGKEVAKQQIDILITVGTQAKHIAKTAKQEGMKQEQIYECGDVNQAIQTIKSIAKKEDLILIKASNGMKFRIIIDAMQKKEESV